MNKKLLIIIGIAGFIVFSLFFPSAQVKFEDQEEYSQTPLGLHLLNEYDGNPNCVGYPNQEPSKSCETRFNFLGLNNSEIFRS